jgi:hypothetical protein
MEKTTIKTLFEITGKTARVFDINQGIVSFLVNEGGKNYLYELETEDMGTDAYLFLLESKENKTVFRFEQYGNELIINEIK